MTENPYLSLGKIKIDPELVRRVPRKFAFYHLALPLARDHHQVSVALANRDNPFVLDTLSKLLNARIVPVLSSAAEIHAALDQVWKEVPLSEPQILTWGRTAERAGLARRVGETLGGLFEAQVTSQHARDFDELLMHTQQDSYILTVVAASASESVSSFIRNASTPVLLVCGDSVPTFAPILLSLRGHAPDRSAMDWVVPLARAYQSETTVLALPPDASPANRRRAGTRTSLADLLDLANEPARHLAECTRRLTEAGIRGYIKLCQGHPIDQIATEFSKGQYALVVVVSEAQGDFVQAAIDRIATIKPGFAVLVVKPAIRS